MLHNARQSNESDVSLKQNTSFLGINFLIYQSLTTSYIFTQAEIILQQKNYIQFIIKEAIKFILIKDRQGV